MMVLQHPLAKDKIDSVISYSGGTLTALSGWASGKAASSVVNTKVYVFSDNACIFSNAVKW